MGGRHRGGLSIIAAAARNAALNLNARAAMFESVAELGHQA